PRYVLCFQDETGYVEKREDPYSFRQILTDYDLYLFGEGTHKQIYQALGAHMKNVNGVNGVLFAVWAPNARSVALIGDFNHWQVGENPMMVRGSSGVWELFVPRLKESEVYKFAIKTNTGKILLKTDPYAFRTEIRPRTAAIVANLDRHDWHDDDWISKRNATNPLDLPISIYELHLGSWKLKPDGSYLSYKEIADELVPYLQKMGFSHVELLPVMEHPLDDSWGYQVVNYYAPTSRFGSPEEFMYFVDMCHRAGIGVILDWVPAHFPKDDYGLALFDGTHLYNHVDPKMGEHPDWGTLIFNYGRNEVKSFLISNAVFWFDRYHVDGLRLDAVASMLYLDYSRKSGEWIPNKYGGRENLEALEFLKETNEAVHSSYKNSITIAEESTAWPKVTHSVTEGGIGFDLKWNMGWMHDTLDYFSTDPIFRKHQQGGLTFSLLYAFSEKFVLVLSHDEVVHGKRSLWNKMPGDSWRKFANLRLCLGYMYTHPGKKLLFMGSEFAQENEWNFRTGLDWNQTKNDANSKFQRFVHDINELYRTKKALYELDFSYEGFEWVDFKDEDQSIISFIRKPRDNRDFIVTVCNMTPVPRSNYRVGVPEEGFYKEILNSDAADYGGSGIGNLGGVTSEQVPWHGRPFSLKLSLPPLGLVLFEIQRPGS
ncbi:MAG TPA: 1,4-alpha-glucan branching protein GlgB, partial [Nitrososphaerales archaeon]|nr:1,4-alpha-glucan branching protein GlgB [Nitrososphaerales archaeon]